ncbi:unnamed protein product [Linum tenue]|uniref:Uncharacterized protein n=1 Tax=Linum tenue TaxID=586396 RepID=A0AAV0GQ98_9ROSI|nr:unnamed protein product [Linum tenue]
MKSKQTIKVAGSSRILQFKPKEAIDKSFCFTSPIIIKKGKGLLLQNWLLKSHGNRTTHRPINQINQQRYSTSLRTEGAKRRETHIGFCIQK